MRCSSSLVAGSVVVGLVAVLWAASMAWQFQRLQPGNVDAFQVLELLPENCQRVSTPAGFVSTEDITLFEDGVFFVSAGDLPTTFGGDAKDARPGSILAFDAAAVKKNVAERHQLQVVPIVGRPTSSAFQPHGLYYSKKTRQLYVVNHPFDGLNSRIEIYRVQQQSPPSPPASSTSSGTDAAPSPAERLPQLHYQGFVESSSFPRGGLNDVIEGRSGSELFVTASMFFDVPSGGVTAEPRDWKDVFNGWVRTKLLWYMGFRLSRVYRCTFELPSSTPTTLNGRSSSPESTDWSIPSTCKSTGGTFSFANGITTNTDRSIVVVSDLGAREVVSFAVNPGDGSLSRSSSVDVPWHIDNVEWAADPTVVLGEDQESTEEEDAIIHAGAIPDLVSTLSGQPQERYEGGYIKLKLRKGGSDASGNANSASSEIVVSDPLFHTPGGVDGSVQAVSAANVYVDPDTRRQQLLLGSPFDAAMLLCDL